MTEENKNINYSAADIEKYRKGEMSPADMHAMEKAALDDPFLADAMEGYGAGREENTMTGDSFQPAIAELKQRLARRVAEKEKAPVITFGWWKAAAVVLVMIGAGWLYNNFSKNKAPDNSIVKNKDIKEEPPAIVKTDSVTNLSAGDSAVAMRDVAAAERKTPVVKPGTSSLYKAKVINTDSLPVAASGITSVEKNKYVAAETEQAAPVTASKANVPAAAKEEDKVAVETIIKRDSKNNDDLNKKAGDNAVAGDTRRKAEGYATASDKETVTNGRANNASAFVNTFNGTIVDQSNRAVSNASIQIPHLNIATQTNKFGNFSFRAPDTVLSVSIASEGFETQNLDLTHNNISRNNNLITLKPRLLNVNDSTLNNDAIKRSQKRGIPKAKDISIQILDAEPVIGWTAYNEYLQKNKRVTEDTKSIHGNVIITFDVHSKWIGSFIVQQSLNEELDEEAIRLIKEGPAWKLLKDKKATVSVTVRF